MPVTEGKSPAKRAREHTREILRERIVLVCGGWWVVEIEVSSAFHLFLFGWVWAKIGKGKDITIDT